MKWITIVAQAVFVLATGCTTAKLVSSQGVSEHIPAVSLEVVGLRVKDQNYVRGYVARGLRESGMEVSPEPASFVTHALAEFAKYDVGSGVLRFLTLNIAGRPSFDVTWTIEAPGSDRTLGTCRVVASVGWQVGAAALIGL